MIELINPFEWEKEPRRRLKKEGKGATSFFRWGGKERGGKKVNTPCHHRTRKKKKSR